MRLPPTSCPQLPPQFNPLLLPKPRGPTSPRGAPEPDAPHPAPHPPSRSPRLCPSRPLQVRAQLPKHLALPRTAGCSAGRAAGRLGWAGDRSGTRPAVPKAGRSEWAGRGGRASAGAPGTSCAATLHPTCPSTAALRGGGRRDRRCFFLLCWVGSLHKLGAGSGST